MRYIFTILVLTAFIGGCVKNTENNKEVNDVKYSKCFMNNSKSIVWTKYEVTVPGRKSKETWYDSNGRLIQSYAFDNVDWSPPGSDIIDDESRCEEDKQNFSGCTSISQKEFEKRW